MRLCPADAREAMRRARQAALANRVPGLHFIGHFWGVEWLETGSGRCRLHLPAAVATCGPEGTLAPETLPLLADLAMGTAVHTLLPPGLRLATAEMRMQYLDGAAAGGAVATAEVHGARGGYTAVTCSVASEDGRPVALAEGSFTRIAARGAPMPWQRSEPVPPPGPPATLTPDERHLLAGVAAALRAARREGCTLPRALVLGRVRSASGRHVRMRFAVRPHMANRNGVVQGGLVCAMLDQLGRALAQALGAGDGLPFVSDVHFLRPAAGRHLDGAAGVLRAGRTFLSLRLGLRDEGGRLVAAAVAGWPRSAVPDAAPPGG